MKTRRGEIRASDGGCILCKSKDGFGTDVCIKCGHTEPHVYGMPKIAMVCGECGAQMYQKFDVISAKVAMVYRNSVLKGLRRR